MLFCIYLLIAPEEKNLIGTPSTLCQKIKPITLIIWSHENFKLRYLRIKFYCFFIAFWPPMPKVILVLLWGWRQIVQQDMTSHSVSHLIFWITSFEVRVSWREEKIRINFYRYFWNNGRCVLLNHKPWYDFVDKSMKNKSI